MSCFALFKLPNQSDTHLIQAEKAIELSKIELEYLPKGFLINSFIDNEKTLLITSSKITLNPDKQEITELNFKQKSSNLSSTTEKSYTNYVDKSVDGIQNGKFKKVVPARTKFIKSYSNDLIDDFFALCDKYPNAFVSLHSTLQYGTWIGASPETLLKVDKNSVLSTVALAGTQLANGREPKEAAWSQKEIEEQALVSRFIIHYFKEIRLREFEEEGPKTVQAGNLFHLKTDYFIDLNKIEHKNLASTLLNLLHPTSAVCGLPKQESLDFILENEEFDRELYTGFIGPVNFNNETHLFVNLRCAKIHANTIQLFAGAGVTKDSDPQKEWLETENKCTTIASVLLNEQTV